MERLRVRVHEDVMYFFLKRDNEIREALLEWFDQNLGYDAKTVSYNGHSYFQFETENDAFAFKMRWGHNCED